MKRAKRTLLGHFDAFNWNTSRDIPLWMLTGMMGRWGTIGRKN